MHHRGRKLMAWLLTASVALSGNSVTALAGELDFSDVQVAEEQVATVTETDENEDLVTEIPVQQEQAEVSAADEEEFGSKEVDLTMENEDTDETELETEDPADNETDAEIVVEEEALFSAGDSEEDDSEKYKIWFENLRDEEYSTYFFDNEKGKLQLNTENLDGVDATISWEVGYRKEEQNEEDDSFMAVTEFSEDMTFWSVKADDNTALEIDGAKLWEAYNWLLENKSKDYWFEARAYVNIKGEEPAYQAQAGINVREHKEKYYFPEDEVLLPGWPFDIERQYDGYIEDAEHLEDCEKQVMVENVTVENVDTENERRDSADAEEAGDVCSLEKTDNGWQIQAQRFGTAKVTLTYTDFHGNPDQTHSFNLEVSGDKYTLEAQLPASENNMLPGSSQEFEFTLYHEWYHDEENQGNEDVADWALNFANDDSDGKYDTNILQDVKINNHTVVVKAQNVYEGTDIPFKATIVTENGSEDIAFYNLYVEVCDEYDVLYPEYIANINVGDTLNLNDTELGLCVEHVKENGEPVVRDDVTLEYDYDQNQWKDITEDEPRPVLQRVTTDRAWLDIRAIDAEKQEICGRHYEFDEIHCDAYFEGLREGDYSTYFYDDENGELQLTTEGLDDDNTKIDWEVGYRKDDQEDEEDSFTEVSNLSEEYKFWSEKADDAYVLEINGEKLSAAYKWLGEEFDEEYWFEVRAHVMTNGIEVRTAQAGINTRKTRVEYYFPGDEVILPGWGHHVDASYNGHIENKDNPDGTDIGVDVTDVSVTNAEDEEDETPVCEIDEESSDENGWEIVAKRVGTAVVTIRYNDIAGEEQTHSYNLYVSGDKYTLEPQWTASCGRMQPDSEMKIPFVLRHEWRYSDTEEGSEDVKDWTLEFASDENGWKYDTNLLPKVEINGQEISITSGDGTWGTDILLKAEIPLEDGTYEDVTSENIHIEVCNEYDVLYPENISNINLGDTLDLNTLGLKVEHINEDGSTSARNDVTYMFEYDGENNWKNTAAEGQLPILTRISTDGTWLNIIAIDEEGNELDRREYRFDWLDYSVWFDNLREDAYMTYAFENEQYEISLNTQNLKEKNAEIIWNVICRQDSEDENYAQIPVLSQYTFWSVDEKDTSKITVDANKLKTAYEWLHSDENLGVSYWFEVQASVKCGDIDLDSRAALGLGQVRKEIEDYDSWFPVKDQKILISDKIWISKEFNVWVENAENPNGAFIPTEVTGVEPLSEGKFECSNKGGGWMLRPLQPGETEFKISYKKLNDETVDQVVRIDVTGKVYGMDLSFADNNNQVLAGETKTIDVAVSYRDEEHPDGERISDSEYSLNVKTDVVDGAELVGNLTFNQKTSKIEVKTNSVGEADSIVVKVKLTLYTKDDDETPVWETEEEFGIYVTPEYEDVVELTDIMFDIPDIGDSFNIMECGAVLKRYDGETESWKEVNENIRFRLEYDDEVWTPTEETKDELVPILTRNKGVYTVLRLVAEEQNYNSTYGRKQWNEVSSRYIAVRESLCEHKWTITAEEPANCINTGKQYKKCEICEKEKEETIPVNGIHTPGEWKVTKVATCSAEGEKTTSCTVCNTIITAKIDKNLTAHSYQWKTDASATCGADGSRHEECKYCGSKGKTEKLSATGAHVLGEWTVTRAATAVAEGTRERHCTVCGGAKETGSVEKLKPSVTLNVPTSKKLPLKVKQSFQVTASGWATGDRVISWTSSNKKIVTVSGNGKITGKKAGQAVVTVTLQSGLSAKFTVKVQKTTVTTTSLLVVNKATGTKLPKTVSMKAKQKLTLLTSATPVTSKQKVTYSSSNKKIATVSSKGVITAKKKGTVTITVKSGKKSVKIKIKVTK